ncbi:MAG TPA: aldehyde dehydrogenase family protein [Jatrophihabitantaceae bacterium]|jgi:acyl-CoA reductase-like NAD-dependent aldehyde dehydrogenase
MNKTQTTDVDVIVERLAIGEKTWAAATLADRARLLAEFRTSLAEVADEWVKIACQIKQLPEESPLVGEEWISGPWAVLSFTGALLETVQRLDRGADVLDGCRFRAAPDNRLAVRVSPFTGFDKLLFSGFRAEVWLRPGVTEADARATAGLGLRTPHETDGVALVLGAGNIFSISPLDTLNQLYAANRAVVLKLNPITDPLLPVFERIFAPFIELGVLEIITADGLLGDALAQHPGIGAVHMTGSEATHDAIVWGTGPDGEAAKHAGTPRLTKPITSELGGVSPIIVVPGNWSGADLRFQAQHVATQRLHNSGHNCVGSQIVIVSSDWAQKDAFLAELRTAVAAAPARPAWYPGCEARVRAARELHPSAEAVGGTPERTLLTGLDLIDADETAFTGEYFGPVLGVAELPGTGERFLSSAVDAANERLRGTLGANILAHPATLAELGPQLEKNIARLRYGTIAVNAWTGVGYLTPRTTWGAFPGHTLDDIQSGCGVVNNALLLDDTERTVVYGPFRPAPRSLLHGELSLTPKPAWFVSNRTAATTGRRLTRFVLRPRWRALPAIFASALRG